MTRERMRLCQTLTTKQENYVIAFDWFFFSLDIDASTLSGHSFRIKVNFQLQHMNVSMDRTHTLTLNEFSQYFPSWKEAARSAGSDKLISCTVNSSTLGNSMSAVSTILTVRLDTIRGHTKYLQKPQSIGFYCAEMICSSRCHTFTTSTQTKCQMSMTICTIIRYVVLASVRGISASIQIHSFRSLHFRKYPESYRPWNLFQFRRKLWLTQ